MSNEVVCENELPSASLGIFRPRGTQSSAVVSHTPVPGRMGHPTPCGICTAAPCVTCLPTSKETLMKYHRSLRHGLLVLSLGLAWLPAWADDDCDAPLKRWQSRDAVLVMAATKGWQIQRLKIDDGCYEIRGTDADGRRFKAKIDPETLKVLKLKQDDRQRAQDRDRTRAHDEQAAPAPGLPSDTAPRDPSQ